MIDAIWLGRASPMVLLGTLALALIILATSLLE
jgi:hypothetical protein